MQRSFESKVGRGAAALFWVLGCAGATLASCGGSGAKNPVSETGGTGGSGGSGGSVGPLEPPPAPPTSGVAAPGGSVAAPNLKVLPWAGFAAAISYTFDDSQPSQLEHLAELEAAGVPMTFFVNPTNNWQSGYDAAFTDAAARGHEIGNHTWTHCHATLSDCTPVGTAEEEIDNTTEYAASHFGVPAVYSFASPFGDTGWDTYASTRFLVGRGVPNGMVSATGVSDWYNLPCIPVAEGQTETDFDAAIDSAKTQGRWGIFLFHSILPTTNNWYAGVELADVTGSMAHAKSLGDVSGRHDGDHRRLCSRGADLRGAAAEQRPLVLDAAEPLSTRQGAARDGQRRNPQPGRRAARVGRARLLRGGARRGVALVEPLSAPSGRSSR